MGTEVQLFKPNELVSAFAELELSRLARHLFNYFIQYAQREIKFNNYQGNTFTLDIHSTNELAEIQKKDYKYIDKALDNLMRPITIRDVDNPKRYTKLVPITKIVVNADRGLYEFELQSDVIKLLQACDYFTKLNLQELNPLKSKHSLIIFEFLKRYENAPKIPLTSVEELRRMTDTQKSRSYDNFTNLKDKVLDVAMKDINALTAYNMSYDALKERTKRRPKVTAIQFYFSKKTENSEIIDVQATDNNSVITPKIQDTSIPKEPKYMNANELYTVFANCFNGLGWGDFCGATYFYDNYTLVAFANWAITQTHKFNKELFAKYLIDRVNDPSYNNYRYRKRQLSEENIRKHLFDLNPNKQIADQGFQAFCELYYYKEPFDQLSLILSKSLQHNAVGAYDFFLKAYEEEKHHFQA